MQIDEKIIDELIKLTTQTTHLLNLNDEKKITFLVKALLTAYLKGKNSVKE